MNADEGATRPGRTGEFDVVAWTGERHVVKPDRVVTEEPLELRVRAGGRTETLGLTMRTPGNDFELAAGFAVGENLVREGAEIAGISYCLDASVEPDQRYNIVTIDLARRALPDLRRLERHYTAGSACGVCGRAHLDSLRDAGIAPIEDDLRVDVARIYELPERMRETQRVFASTGGLHAAAAFDEASAPMAAREDVGRHNAVDKLVGWGLLTGRLPFERTVLAVSGRAGYEIVQKSVVARIPIVCSVSAPSSLAVDLARAFNVTLVGFVRDGRANVYSAPERIIAREMRAAAR